MSDSFKQDMNSGTRLLDYLAVTDSNDSSLSEILQLFPVELISRGHGQQRYRQGAWDDLGMFKVLWDGVTSDMGIHFIISGDGMRLLESQPNFPKDSQGEPNWREWLGVNVLEVSTRRLARLDVAFDDRSGSIKMETVKALAEGGHVARRGNSDSTGGHYQTRNGIKTETFYIGSRQSEVMLRVYDKGRQLKESLSWLRFEFELKRKRAQAWLQIFVRSGWEAGAASLRGVMDFKDPDDVNVQRDRRRPAQWWADLISKSRQAFKISATVHRSIAKTKEWLIRQVSTASAMICLHEDGDLTWLHNMVAEGRHKLKKQHYCMIETAKMLGTTKILKNPLAFSV